MNDIDTSDRPKWLLELENRKRKPRLAHEAGAGAPCVICKETCPGLDLHFWRKICKNCKCSKDDHDVEDDDFPQFDLLFGPSKKHKTKPTLLHINGGKEHVEEAFEWIPPDTTKDLAADYMKALPIEKLPIKGSAGAALRRQLLQKQLPLHDIDYKTCDKLSDQEKKEFENYLENIKKYVGQGAVIKILSARPYNGSLLTPVNATDMQQLSLQNKPNAPSKFVQLRTPSSFAPKNSYKKSVHENANMQEFPPSLETLRNCDINVPIVEKYNTIGNNSEIIRSKPIKDGFYNQAIHPNDFKQGHSLPLNTVRNVSTTENPNYLNDITSSQNPSESYKHMLETPSTTLIHSRPIDGNVDAAEAILADALLSSSTTQANDIIGSTLDEKGLMYIREKLTNKYSKQENQMQPPYGVPNLARSLDSNNSLCKNSSLRSQNTDLLTNAGSNTDRTVSTKSSGILTPSQQLNLPISKPISAEVEAIKSNSKTAQFDPLVSAQTLNTQSLRDNTSPILLRTADNSAQTLSSQSCLQSCNNDHPAKLNSFTTPSAVIYSQQLQNQIFPHEIVSIAKELEQSYPRGEQLESAIKELTIDANKSQKCHKCEEEIRVGDVAIVAEKAKNTVWHPGCFVCNTCNELLVDLVYFYYKNKLYCGRDLATLLGIPRCFACDELIFVREYTVAEGHNYHVQHFCCWDCDVPLAGKQYITENDRPLCLLCYQKTYAKTCNTCERVIAADQQGVAVKDLNFHAIGNCFCCHVCNKNLLNGKFAVKESRLFCSKECISNFYVSTK